ncbi:gsl3857 [Gloeobacter violaceus PCC 7421]|uniref:Gsl3857 protein n=1 Tax=Gloeobacter violaceus (strain ATCC 29082 / PCC 7421) TaxID=251221 RepID=Q7NEM2_GLOVI|nr:gsl3857 [Gloeobacter violaceus PCC 7421]
MLSDEQRALLEKLVARHGTFQQLAQRSRLILAADSGLNSCWCGLRLCWKSSP